MLSELMSDGVLSVVAPAGWHVEHYEPSSSDDFPADMLTAMAWDKEYADSFSAPRAYVGQRDYGSLKDFAETILSWEQYEMCLPDDFSQVVWVDAGVGELRGYRFRTELVFEELPPSQIVEVLVVARPKTPAELVQGPMNDVLTAVATRYPSDDPVCREKIGQVWESLKTCDQPG